MSTTPDHTKYNKGDKNTLGDMFTSLTPGVKNIQAAYSRAGATDHHTPGAASKLGSQEQHGRSDTIYREGGKTGTSEDVREPSAIGQFAKDVLGATNLNKGIGNH